MKLKQTIKRTLFGLMLVLMGMCLYVVISFSIRDQSIGEIEDNSRYSEIRDQYPRITPHFPQSIPADAHGVRFHFHPAIMQGGTVIQLRMQLAPGQIEKAVDDNARDAVMIFADETVVKDEIGIGDMPQPQILVKDKSEHLGKDCSTYVLYGESSANGKPQWNHGTAYGAMICESDRIIVYWAEEW